MPFEIIEVSMYLYELFSEGFTLYFEYYSVSEHGTRRRKLAHGEHSVVWVPEGQELSSEIHPAKMPEEYVAHFMTMIDNSEKSHSSAPAQEGEMRMRHDSLDEYSRRNPATDFRL